MKKRSNKDNKNNKDTVSVIIPVYNQDKYLRRCLDSVIGQTYEALEILVIDDGSTDDCPAICDQYAETDKRIKVIHQSNKGLSGARNTGLEHCSCNTLMFLDSDDEMLPTMVETLTDVMQMTDADIVVCDYMEIIQGEEAPAELRSREYKGVTDEEVSVTGGKSKYNLLWDKNLVAPVQWNKLFRRKIFETYRFPEGRYHEDEYAIHHEYDAADKIAEIHRILHLYYRHIESITVQATMKKRIDAAEGLLERVAFFMKKRYFLFAMMSYHGFTWIVEDALEHKDCYDDTPDMLPQMQAIVKRERYRMAAVKRIGKAYYRWSALSDRIKQSLAK